MQRNYYKGKITNKTIKFVPVVEFNKTIKYRSDAGKRVSRNSKTARKTHKNNIDI
jgi:hypothetical protein